MMVSLVFYSSSTIATGATPPLQGFKRNRNTYKQINTVTSNKVETQLRFANTYVEASFLYLIYYMHIYFWLNSFGKVSI